MYTKSMLQCNLLQLYVGTSYCICKNMLNVTRKVTFDVVVMSNCVSTDGGTVRSLIASCILTRAADGSADIVG